MKSYINKPHSSVICHAPQALSEIYIEGIFYIYKQCFSLSTCGARQMTEEWASLI
jgi:hypothetical protein